MSSPENAVKDRANLLALTRSELVGPSRYLDKASEVKIVEGTVRLDETQGPVFVKNADTGVFEELLYDRNEGPTRKYGIGILHPTWQSQQPAIEDELEDVVGCDSSVESDESDESDEVSIPAKSGDGDDESDPDLPLTNRFRQSTLGVSFCVRLPENSKLAIALPTEVKYEWQHESDTPFPVNGFYRSVTVNKVIENGAKPIYFRGAARSNAFPSDFKVEIEASEIQSKSYFTKQVEVADGNSRLYELSVKSRNMPADDHWLITITLSNQTVAVADQARNHQFMLFQAYFDVSVTGEGSFMPYPVAQTAGFSDTERDSLQLLYRNSKTWAIGHNCAAGWKKNAGKSPELIYADVFPVVETPSMTPDITDSSGNGLTFSMSELSMLDDSGISETWQKLDRLPYEYEAWLGPPDSSTGLKHDLLSVETMYQNTAKRHIADCQAVLDRIKKGIMVLKTNENARTAFRLANKAMVLQQIATKQLKKRKLYFDPSSGRKGKVKPAGEYKTPKQIYDAGTIDSSIGKWRAFQLAFLLMNIPDFLNEGNDEYEKLRENIELIWFPTGGGKTEAYLGVAAYSLFLSRLNYGDQVAAGESPLPVDGTNILMRYTLRMLTTQQFQRAAALICAMECIRQTHDEKKIAGGSFSLGLWIGTDGVPNKNLQAINEIREYKNEPKKLNNPLVVTECPWCRSQLGKAEIKRPAKGWREQDWKHEVLKGICEENQEPILHCSDTECVFSDRLPILVIDEQIYNRPPSLIIGTADKFAVIAYRPKARAIFGRSDNGDIIRRPPCLIIQDETHLIAGPLGTLFGLYESAIEKLCTLNNNNGVDSKPKIICSTATIRGAKEQLLSIFARNSFTLFPSPGLDISDSFFGRYAKENDSEKLMPGRMYVGVNASGYVSSQTTQVRVFSSLLVNVQNHIKETDRDPWWTILSFYNSLRELGGALTLFQGDIKSRMKFLTRRDKLEFRNDPRSIELSSRLEQSEIVEIMSLLELEYLGNEERPVDVCLSSSIIEVGVDIDRLSLMAVVGQPKNTAQYIQVTGRVGRRWWERPGLVFTLYSSTKIRDQSHYEQFYSYHGRLYEQVEPTSATPFSRASLERAAIGAMFLYARCISPETTTANYSSYSESLREAKELLISRCEAVEKEHAQEIVPIIEKLHEEIKTRWTTEREFWERIPLETDDSVLLRWPGHFSSAAQKKTTFEIPSSLRQVDKAGALEITKHYVLKENYGT
ncbi:MAG: hypothetical protein CME31_22460 [Gimesia sp.]|uniref:Helicase C-terminal domain-containing protein n=1 Tax=Gimesia maris TaxID=122 RepID=A0A3D3RG54_9PLAN|nr:hypothetical protein [Gimesia sp.]HCO27058.1 hypothetical protein [Gimesia maris]|tara:strand:+ start:9020 stop:12697 length:3678 start_codon:yes stop_codon:yes gene_type:complete